MHAKARRAGDRHHHAHARDGGHGGRALGAADDYGDEPGKQHVVEGVSASEGAHLVTDAGGLNHPAERAARRNNQDHHAGHLDRLAQPGSDGFP